MSRAPFPNAISDSTLIISEAPSEIYGYVGSSITIKVQLQNNDDQESKEVKLSVVINDEIMNEVSISPLEAGQSAYYSLKFSPTEVGYSSIVLKLEDQGLIDFRFITIVVEERLSLLARIQPWIGYLFCGFGFVLFFVGGLGWIFVRRKVR